MHVELSLWLLAGWFLSPKSSGGVWITHNDGGVRSKLSKSLLNSLFLRSLFSENCMYSFLPRMRRKGRGINRGFKMEALCFDISFFCFSVDGGGIVSLYKRLHDITKWIFFSLFLFNYFIKL